jgi:hypothetical protein
MIRAKTRWTSSGRKVTKSVRRIAWSRAVGIGLDRSRGSEPPLCATLLAIASMIVPFLRPSTPRIEDSPSLDDPVGLGDEPLASPPAPIHSGLGRLVPFVANLRSQHGIVATKGRR